MNTIFALIVTLSSPIHGSHIVAAYSLEGFHSMSACQKAQAQDVRTMAWIAGRAERVQGRCVA